MRKLAENCRRADATEEWWEKECRRLDAGEGEGKEANECRRADASEDEEKEEKKDEEEGQGEEEEDQEESGEEKETASEVEESETEKGATECGRADAGEASEVSGQLATVPFEAAAWDWNEARKKRMGSLWVSSLNGKKLQVKKVSRDGEDSAVVFLQLDGKKWKQLAEVLTKWFEGDVHSQRVRAVMAATALCDKIQCKHIEATDDAIKPERNRLVAHYGGQVNKAGYNKRSAAADGGEAACDAAPKNQKSVPKAQKAMPKEGGKPKRCRRADTGDDEGKEEKKDKEEGQGEVEQEESGKEKETVKEVQESEKEKGQEGNEEHLQIVAESATSSDEDESATSSDEEMPPLYGL